MGIGGKCFEILENKPTSTSNTNNFDMGASGYDQHDGMPSHSGYAPLGADGDVTDDEEEMEEGMEDEEDIIGGPVGDEEDDDLDAVNDAWDEDEDDDDFEAEMAGSRRLRLRLREILFYDDRVAVFRARHGRL